MSANGHMDIASAIRHLRERHAHVGTFGSRHRPHWTQADMDAVSALVDTPAAAEQIALARIEGRTANGTLWDSDTKVVNNIARKALGLPLR